MAAPNIVGVTSIIGVSTFISGISSTAYTTIISHAANTNQVWKLNTLVASNTSATNTITVSLKFFGQAAGLGNSTFMGSAISIPSGSTVVFIGKDNPVYVEENRSIGATANGANAIDIYASYESIA